MIEGVKIKQLVAHSDDRGFFMEILRDDDNMLSKFGQTSMSLAYPGVIKAFHWHKEQDDVWFFSSGMAQIVLYDLRPFSSTYKQTQVIFAGEQNHCLVLIPKGVAHGYKVIGDKPAVLFYHTTNSYNKNNPDEERISFDDPQIGFDWERKNR